jgi:hypothetical protein
MVLFSDCYYDYHFDLVAALTYNIIFCSPFSLFDICKHYGFRSILLPNLLTTLLNLFCSFFAGFHFLQFVVVEAFCWSLILSFLGSGVLSEVKEKFSKILVAVDGSDPSMTQQIMLLQWQKTRR